MNEVPIKLYRPEFSLYHANSKGTGGAVKMSLHPAHDGKEGCIMLSMARQKSVGDRHAATPTFSTFDWEHKLIVKLDFADVCKMLQVLHGECESADEGRGMLHHSTCGLTKIVFRHQQDPIPGYSLELYRRKEGEAKDTFARFVIFPHEAVGVTLAFEESMMYLMFGIPMVIPHNTSRYEEEARHVSIEK